MEMLLGIGSMVFLLMIAMGVLLGVFWIWMFIDAIINQNEDKIVWLLVVFFLSGLGAILYYFLARKKRLPAMATVNAPRTASGQQVFSPAPTLSGAGCEHQNEAGSAYCGECGARL